MKLHIYLLQVAIAALMIIVFPIYFANSAGLPPVVTIDIQKFKFIPQEVTVKAGTKIIWVNKEKRQYHSVWFEQLGEPEPEYFFPDETYERNFDTPGTFPYRCGPHPKMTGVVHVK